MTWVWAVVGICLGALVAMATVLVRRPRYGYLYTVYPNGAEEVRTIETADQYELAKQLADAEDALARIRRLSLENPYMSGGNRLRAIRCVADAALRDQGGEEP